MTTTELETLIVRLVGNSTSYLKMLGQAQRATATFAASVRQTMSGLQMTVALPLAAIGAAAVKQFANFDNAITESAAIMDVTDEQMKQMSKTALDLATKSVQGPIELARGFYNLASAGLSAEQAMKALPIVAKFATAGAMDLSSAIDHLSGAQSALGMRDVDPTKNMLKMTKVADVLVAANNKALGTTRQFAEALSNDAAAAMRVFGIELEDGVAALMAMAEQGNKGQKAGGDLARMLRLVSNAATKNYKEFEKLGVKFFDANGETRSLVDIIGDLESVLNGANHESKVAALNMLGIQARSQNAIFPLIGMSKRMAEFREELKKAKGVTDEVANKQLRSFTKQLQITWNHIAVLATRVGEILAPSLIVVGEGVKWLTKQFLQLSPSTQRIIVLASALAATLIIVTAAVSLLAFIFGGMITTLLPPLAAIIGIAAYLAYLEQTTGGVTKAWEYLQKVGVKVWASLVKVFTQLAAETQPVIDAIVDVATAIWKELSPIIADIQVELQELWKEIGRDVKDIWEWTTPLRVALFDLAAVLVKVVGAGFLTVLKNALLSIKGIIYLFRVAYGYISGVMVNIEHHTGKTWDDIRAIMLTVIARAEFAIANFGKVTDLVFTTIGLGLVRLGENFKHLFGSTIPHLVNYFKEYAIAVFDAVFDYIKQFTINSINLLANIPNLVPELVAKVGTGKELQKALELAFRYIVPKKLDIKLPKLDLPKRGESPLEAEIFKMIQESIKGLDADFDKFLEEKLKRFNKPIKLQHPIDLPLGEELLPKVDEDVIENLGKQIGKALNIGIGKEMDKFQVPDRWEGVLADSVKGMIELQEYRKKIFGGRFLPDSSKPPKDLPPKPLIPPPGFGPGSEPDFRPFNPEPPNIPKPPKIDTPWMPPDNQFPPFDIPHIPDVEIKPGLAKFSPTIPSIGNPLKGIGEFLKDNLPQMPDKSTRPIPVQVTTTPNSQGISNAPDVKEMGNRLVTRDERVPGLLEEILRELKLSNKNNKLKIGGGLS